MSDYKILLDDGVVRLVSDSDEIYVCKKETLFEILAENDGVAQTEAVNKINSDLPVSSKLVRKCRDDDRKAAIFLAGFLDTV